MSINKLISIKEAILEASEDMGFDLTRDKPTFAMWAVRAEKDIGSYYSYKRLHKVITIKNCRAELPCNAAYLKAIISGDHGCDCGELFSGMLQWASAGVSLSNSEIFVVVDQAAPGDVPYGVTGSGYEIQDNCIVFKRDMDGEVITVEYLGLEEDCDGFVMVNENHKPAIISYIMWKFAVRSRFSQIKMELGDIKMHQQEYNRLVSDSRAMDGELTPAERAICVSMLQDPWSGWGLSIGSSSDYSLTY